ncbi:prepilin peptidase [Photobacterium sp. Hal280]|uniref:prepilin peptidase n=1 Tax=Photobacterium sp. Hal280 TaxID=3035163 RepID=UPI00301CEF2F
MNLYDEYFLVFVLSLCAMQDLKLRKVSNVFPVILLIYFLFLNDEGVFDIHESIFSLIFVALLSLPGFIKGVFGAADVKLVLLLSVILPASKTLDFLLYSFISFAVYWLLFARGQKEAPFVPSLLVGVVVSLWIL